MSQDAYVGLPGAGKSHGVVMSVILPALKQGRRIVHNMPLVPDELHKLEPSGELVPVPEFTDADIDVYLASESFTSQNIDLAKFKKWNRGLQLAQLFIEWFRREHAGALLVLDEAWQYWPSGLAANSIPEAQRQFFAMHRHMTGQTPDGRTTDIVLVAQNLSQIARFVVDLTEQTFHYVKQTVIGSKNRFRCDVYQGPVTGPKPNTKNRTNSYHGKYKPEIFKCYKSHTLSKTGMAGMEDKSDKRGNILHSWRFRFLVISPVLFVAIFIYARHAFFGMAGKPASEAAAGQAGGQRSAAASPAVRAAPAVPKPPAVSEIWRVAGEITRRGKIAVVLVSDNGSRYLSDAACPPDAFGSRSCVLDGEIVTEYSGHRAFNAAQQIAADAMTPNKQP